MGKSSPKAPPAPDYAGAAVAQGAANKETAIASNLLNNPNVVNPYGTQTWTGGESGGRPTMVQRLSPTEQQKYDQEARTAGLLGGLGEQGAKSLKGVVGKKLDFSRMPAAPTSTEARQDAYDAIMSRVNEETAGSKDKQNSMLIAAGIRPGTKAYQDAMYAIDRGANDARQQAILAAGQEGQRDFTMGTQERKDAIAELLAQRQTPLNEINALMSGSQVTNPFAMPGAAQNANIQPAPLYNAALQKGQYETDAYNQQQANRNSAMGGLFSLGAAAMPYMFSDARLKSRIRRIGTHPIGVGIYEYEIFGEPGVGVMAQELLSVKPEAVMLGPDGFYRVDYGRL